MIENVIEFFKNLPKKTCGTCGNEINEQFDCYTNVCQDCDKI